MSVRPTEILALAIGLLTAGLSGTSSPDQMVDACRDQGSHSGSASESKELVEEALRAAERGARDGLRRIGRVR